MKTAHIIKKNAGFTLLELMIVIVILGILGAIVVPQFMDEPHKARIVQTRLQIENLSTALNKFYLDNGFYPAPEQGLEALVEMPISGRTPRNYPKNGYLTKIPQDPWGSDYIYIVPGERTPFEIMSFGADAREGGEEEGADIFSQNSSKS